MKLVLTPPPLPVLKSFVSFYFDGSPESLEYRGLVFASKVKSRNIFSDISSCFVSCCGGEVKDLSKLTNDIREGIIFFVWT